TNDAGSGAYTVVAHNPQELTVMRRFDDYFLGFAENAPDEVHLRYSLEAATVRALMSRREHDITRQWLPTEVLAALAREGFPIYTEGGTSVFYITLNTQRPPTDDAHVRRAIALAFDYDALISILAVTPDLSLGQKVAGPLPNGFPGADPSLPLPERDVAAARAELAQSSYGPSELTMDIAWVAEVPMEEKVALLFQQNLAEIGIDVNIVRVPWTLLTEQAANADTTPHATTVFVSAPVPDPAAQLYSMYHSEAAGTWLSMSWVNDERVDALLNQGRLETDPQERERIYHELQRRLLDIRPAIFGYDQFAAFAHQPNVVVPTLEDHSRSVGGVMGGNWLFRLIEVRDGTRDARSAGGGLAAAATRPAEGEMTNLLSFIGRRLLASLGVLVGESIVIFVIDRVIPGDPARIALGPMASAAQVEALRRQLYLDRPLPLQYYEFVKRSLRGDLGVSLYT